MRWKNACDFSWCTCNCCCWNLKYIDRINMHSDWFSGVTVLVLLQSRALFFIHRSNSLCVTRGLSLSQGSYQGGPMPGLYLLHQKESYLSTHAMVAPTVGLFFDIKYKRTNALPVAQTIECHSLHSWTPEKPDARLIALEESASPAWLAAPSTSRDPNKKYT